jgi:hypothetical protein
MIDLTPVKSSNVAAVGHDAQANELHVQFKSGNSYVYNGVTADQHKALMSADSVGSHLHKIIKPAAKSVRNVTPSK